MEEPEIAIPPHTQKRIVDCMRQRSAQVFFTSHSPYVLEEFSPSHVLVLRRDAGTLMAVPAELPPAVKPKAYRTEFRTRFCEALLARRVLIVEGRTEYDAFPAASRRLHELHPGDCRTLESLGVAVVNAQTDSQVAALGEYFSKIGKIVIAVFDKQSPEAKQAIDLVVSQSFEVPEKGFENLILNQTAEPALRRYAADLIANGDWPGHLAANSPTDTTPIGSLRDVLSEYLRWGKGAGTAADLLSQCSRDEMPEFVVDTLLAIQTEIEPVVAVAPHDTAPQVSESE